jgi:hypothetical protein
MLSAINLYNEAAFQTHKIHDVRIDHVLTAELASRDLLVSQAMPEKSFSVGCFFS